MDGRTPPPEALIIYDDSTAPCVNDPSSALFVRRDKLPNPPAADYPVENYL
jgi:hypothetical protein